MVLMMVGVVIMALFIPLPPDTTVCYQDSTYPGKWLSDYSDSGFCEFGEDNK